MRFAYVCDGLIAGSLLLAEVAAAQPAIEKSQDFARTFIGACVQSFPDIDRTKAAAKAFDWREITDPNLRALMAPAEPGGTFSMWGFREAGAFYMIAVAENKIGAFNFKSCGLVQDNVDVGRIISALSELLAPRKLDERTEAGQKNTVWSIRKDGQEYLVMIVDGSPMQMPMINVTIMTDPRKCN